jgi:NAD(P)H dehydrogenase (quinone)
MPAMLAPVTDRPQLSRKSAARIARPVAGSRYVTYEKYGYDQAMRTQIDIGVMSYAGLHDVRSQFFYEVDDDLESHEQHLRLAYDLGKTFLATQRA